VVGGLRDKAADSRILPPCFSESLFWRNQSILQAGRKPVRASPGRRLGIHCGRV